jgi:gamma-glutamyltranspeptidase/glutathione hydrolase
MLSEIVSGQRARRAPSATPDDACSRWTGPYVVSDPGCSPVARAARSARDRVSQPQSGRVHVGRGLRKLASLISHKPGGSPAGRVRRTCASLAVLLLAALAAAAPAYAKQTVAIGTGGAVASDTPAATNAGLSVLRRGGTAADAAVAVASTLGVSDPLVAGIGGGGYFVYYDASTHRVDTIDGRETAPATASSNLFIDPQTGKPLDFPTAVTSGLSVGVPGTLMTWQRALSRWGRFSLAADLRPAEKVAQAGFRVSAALREEIRENAFRFIDFSSTRALFLPHGRLPAVGSLMRNPALASTYRQIARAGVAAFYGGRIGAAIVHTVHDLPLAPGTLLVPRPGLMALSDLSGYKAILRAPTHVRYRGFDVYSIAPSSSGGTTVGESLNILSNFQLSHESRVQALHHFLEATRLAFADRNRYIGDPAFVRRAASPAALAAVRDPAGMPDQPCSCSHQPSGARQPVRGLWRLCATTADRRSAGKRRRQHEPFRGR